MIKVICGKKGVGKTRNLVEATNNMSEESSGDVVFIDKTSKSMYDLRHKVRFINLSEFPVTIDRACSFLGFLCGMISEDYDIKGVFVDDLLKIVDDEIENLQSFFEDIDRIVSKFNIDFYFSIEGDTESIPEFIKKYC